MERFLLTEMTPHLLREKLVSTPVAYLPLGTAGMVGAHLPLGMGAFYAQGLLSAVAREVGGVVLPTLFLTPIENNSPDQILFGAPVKVFQDVVESCLRDLPGLGVKIVAALGDPSSLAILDQNRSAWKEQYGLRMITLEPSVTGEFTKGNPPLAVGVETSLMMAICPDLVELRYLSEDHEDWPRGVNGSDPRTAAYAENGERILDRQVNQMAAVVREHLRRLSLGSPH